MPYIPYTEEEKQLANSVDLTEFLRMRGEKLEKVGREYKLIYYDGSGKHDSIMIHGAAWFDHKNQVGGGAIQFMRYFYGMDFQTVMNELLGRSVAPIAHSPPKAAVQEKKIKKFHLPKANENMHRVYAYLIKQRFRRKLSHILQNSTRCTRMQNIITQCLWAWMKTVLPGRRICALPIPLGKLFELLVRVPTPDTALPTLVSQANCLCLRRL